MKDVSNEPKLFAYRLSCAEISPSMFIMKHERIQYALHLFYRQFCESQQVHILSVKVSKAEEYDALDIQKGEAVKEDRAKDLLKQLFEERLIKNQFDYLATQKQIAEKYKNFDSSPDADGNLLTLATRDSGSIYDETPGKEDIAAARKIALEIMRDHPNASAKVDTVDEWTNVDILTYNKAIPSRPPSGKDVSAAKEILADLYKSRCPEGLRVSVGYTSDGVSHNVQTKDDKMKYGEAFASLDIHVNRPNRDKRTNNPDDVSHFEWNLSLQIGKHTVPLSSLEKKDIETSLSAVAKSSDNLRDVFKEQVVFKDSRGYYCHGRMYCPYPKCAESKKDRFYGDPKEIKSYLARLSDTDFKPFRCVAGYREIPFGEKFPHEEQVSTMPAPFNSLGNLTQTEKIK